MSAAEAIVIVVAIVVATVAAVLNGDVPPVLAGILGVALGYVGKAAVNTVAVAPRRSEPTPFSGAPED